MENLTDKKYEIEHDLKPGTTICIREYQPYINDFNWTFRKIKKVTPTGKIRLTSDELLNNLYPYKVFDEEMQKLYLMDTLKHNVVRMVNSMINDHTIKKDLSFDEIMQIGNLLNSFKLSDKTWYRDNLHETYDKALHDFNICKDELDKLK